MRKFVLLLTIALASLLGIALGFVLHRSGSTPLAVPATSSTAPRATMSGRSDAIAATLFVHQTMRMDVPPDERWTRLRVTIGEDSFTSVSALQTYIVSLPHGTKVRWESGCLWNFKRLPLDGPLTSMADFTTFCGEQGIAFHYRPGW